ncbi:MAG: hypothetical protein DMF68_16195 [Acidobacteria bacterium]|nr:MAG: hypothetical protein DMF68_16195 [Acidobacteriota bacterium]
MAARTCPVCDRFYGDDAVTFCLVDGSALVNPDGSQVEIAIERPAERDLSLTQIPVKEMAMAEVEHGDEHFAGSNKLFISVWVWLLALTGVEVYLGYIHLNVQLMLTILLGISIIKAALIVAYFMHLRFERLSLVLTLVPILAVCICLLMVFFPDSFRSKNNRYRFQSSTQTETTEEP